MEKKGMTKRELKIMTRRLIRESARHMSKNVDRAVDSGAIDVGSWDKGDYRLAKMVLCALLKEEGSQYFPLYGTKKETENEINNIYLMM